MIREKDKEEKAIDNINYKDAKDDMQKDNGIKVASSNFNKMEMMDLKKEMRMFFLPSLVINPQF